MYFLHLLFILAAYFKTVALNSRFFHQQAFLLWPSSGSATSKAER
jgi:hypothetical protein